MLDPPSSVGFLVSVLGGREKMFSIGEFSTITGMTVKALRFYHEQGLLLPSCVDEESGYRYYDSSKIETARIIALLRSLDFSVNEIGEILTREGDDAELVRVLQHQKANVESKIRRLKSIVVSLNGFINELAEAKRIMQQSTFEVQEKQIPSQLVAGVRMQAPYSECGKGFAQIGRKFGRQICGKCFLLHFDAEYQEDAADFEACMPIRKGASTEDIAVRELPGGRFACLVYQGPYDRIGQAYAKVLAHVKDKGCSVLLPTREVYLKGPGMIFKGNPRKYLTEIQLPISDP